MPTFLALPWLNFCGSLSTVFPFSVTLMFWAFLSGLLLTGAHLSAQGHPFARANRSLPITPFGRLRYHSGL